MTRFHRAVKTHVDRDCVLTPLGRFRQDMFDRAVIELSPSSIPTAPFHALLPDPVEHTPMLLPDTLPWTSHRSGKLCERAT